MGPAEHSRFLAANGPVGPAESTLAGPASALPAIPSGEGSDGPGGCWESAWIDLGGEG